MARCIKATFVLGDVVFEKSCKSKAGLIERKMIPHVKHETRHLTAHNVLPSHHSHQRDQTCFRWCCKTSQHSPARQRLPGPNWEDVTSRQGPTVELQVRFAAERQPTVLSSVLYAHFVRECAERVLHCILFISRHRSVHRVAQGRGCFEVLELIFSTLSDSANTEASFLNHSWPGEVQT